MRLLAISLIVACLTPSALSAQDRSVLFIHGYRSNGASWAATANRLQNDLSLQATRRDTDPSRPYEQQASDLQAQTWLLPPNTVAVGHSNGGIIARQLSRNRPLGAIITLGTPHQGTRLATSGNEIVAFHTLLLVEGSGLADWLVGWFGNHPIAVALFDLHHGWYAGALGVLSSFVDAAQNPVLSQMGPVSSFRQGLNASVSQEPPTRVGWAFTAERHWEGGLFLALAPQHRDTYFDIKAYSVWGANTAGQYLTYNFPPYSIQHTVGQKAFYVAYMLDNADAQWCKAITGSELCGGTNANDHMRHDGVVPVASQYYPSAVNLHSDGPAHTQEKDAAYDGLYHLLTTFTNIPPRSSGGGSGSGGGTGGGGSGGGSGCSGNELSQGQGLVAGQRLCSTNSLYSLNYQGDGNLVVYGPGGPGWSTETFGSPGSVDMQGDGNFVVYDSTGWPVWSTATAGNPGARLALQDDGNLVLYSSAGGVLWSIW